MRITKLALMATLFSTSVFAGDSCVILSQPHAFGWTYNSTRRMHFVAGEFPKGMKFKNNLSDKDVQALRDAGARVIVLNAKYSMEDVEKAQAQCHATENAESKGENHDVQK